MTDLSPTAGLRLHDRLLLICGFWLLIVSGSLAWNLHQAKQSRDLLARQTANAFFEQLLLTRHWNALHGGVYVPVTEATQPNPHLEDEQREIRVSDDLMLTKVNPAFMTRQLSEMAMERSSVQFHITSLNPIRPANTPYPWEAQALKQFEVGVKEFGEIAREGERLIYRYMAPLITEQACLKCHADQGYQVGDIRGGVSVTLPTLAPLPIAGLVGSHIAIAVSGLLLILGLGWLLRRAYDELRRQAVVDALTSIPNRRYFVEQLIRELHRGAREQVPLSLIIFDIDYFKHYNDHYGHLAGDRCLRTVADTLKAGLHRATDFCARYGGEEFVVVLPNTGPKGAAKIAEELRRSISSLDLEHAAAPFGKVTISAGVATNTLGALDHESLIDRADGALYQAKARGRNRVETEVAGERAPSKQGPPAIAAAHRAEGRFRAAPV
ncbi:diguanylate cyclase [Lamprobacter modestohalophilus]|uniref:sensor domain-containing diguanylate cyclase n=1 Tax=Lamprobacter modestohalophilus TaxID=1064514 RepID=UPI002ADECB07|nr:diguanylate cyclase [Lamprobacter modestohalophilus]MEA1048282.1 diguanylate cyclase [Lamprobacter modestohalophilus]